MYADYGFYTDSYYGDLIAEEDFAKYGSRASDFLDLITSGQLVDNLPSDETSLSKVRKACCAVADEMCRIDMLRTSQAAAAAGGGAVKSLSSGGESISYELSEITKAVNGNQQTISRYLYQTAKVYLSGVSDDNASLYLYEGL